jgi:hypothetical protein
MTRQLSTAVGVAFTLVLILPSPVAVSGTGGSGRFQSYMDIKDVTASANDLLVGLTSKVSGADGFHLYPGMALHISSTGNIKLTRIRNGGRAVRKGEFHVVQQVLSPGGYRVKSSSSPMIRTTTTCTAGCTSNTPTISNLCEAKYDSAGSWDDCDAVLDMNNAASSTSRFGKRTGTSCSYSDLSIDGSGYSRSDITPFTMTAAHTWSLSTSGNTCTAASPNLFRIYTATTDSDTPPWSGMRRAGDYEVGTVVQSEVYSTVTTSYRMGR